MVFNVYIEASKDVLQLLLVHTIQWITCYGVEILVSVYTDDGREARPKIAVCTNGQITVPRSRIRQNVYTTNLRVACAKEHSVHDTQHNTLYTEIARTCVHRGRAVYVAVAPCALLTHRAHYGCEIRPYGCSTACSTPATPTGAWLCAGPRRGRGSRARRRAGSAVPRPRVVRARERSASR